jgi:hypothetical protein
VNYGSASGGFRLWLLLTKSIKYAHEFSRAPSFYRIANLMTLIVSDKFVAVMSKDYENGIKPLRG